MITTNSEWFLLDAKRPVSFPIEDKHVVASRCDATQEKCPHVVHCNLPRDWFETNSRHQKRYSEGGKKRWCRWCRGLLRRVM